MDNRVPVREQRVHLLDALLRNAGENRVLLMDRKTTQFVGTADELPENETIEAIRSVPTHFAG